MHVLDLEAGSLGEDVATPDITAGDHTIRDVAFLGVQVVGVTVAINGEVCVLDIQSHYF